MKEVYGSKMDETEGSYGLLQSEMVGGGGEGGHISLRKVVLSLKHSAQGMTEVYGSKMDETGVMGVTGAIRNGGGNFPQESCAVCETFCSGNNESLWE